MNIDTFSACFNRGYDCAMIGHTQLFLWSSYFDIISLLTITVQGVSNKHCLLPFFTLFYVCLRSIYMWKAQGVPQYNKAAHPKHPEKEETSPNRNHIITSNR